MFHRSSVWCITVALTIAAAGATGSAAPDDEWSPLAISTDFPSGSGEVESIDQQARIIRISPTIHSDRGWSCWWYFKVTGLTPGETLTIDLGGDKWAQPARASFSTDEKSWQHTQPGEKRDGRIVYQQQVDAPEAWFAWGPPFTDVDAAELVKSAAKESPYAEAWTLCHSHEDRPIPALRVKQPGVEDEDRYGIWVGARQHAWESGSSWVARGFVEWLISDESRAETLRKKATIVVVPVMDVDNVAIGAGGKYQKPHDHNRDWSNEPHFPEVAAAQREIKRLDKAGRFDLFLDLHNPAPERRDPYFAVPPPAMYADQASANLERFLMTVRTELTEPLAFLGRTVESSYATDPLWVQKSSVWVVQNTADHVVALALETPWNTPHSTAEGYRAVGRKLGLTIDRYFRQPPNERTPTDP